MQEQTITEVFEILTNSDAIKVANSHNSSSIALVSITQQIAELIAKTFATLNIHGTDVGQKLGEFFEIKNIDQCEQLIYSIMLIIVIMSFSLTLNNSQFALEKLYEYRDKFEPGTEQWEKVDILCFFWQKEKEIMGMNLRASSDRSLFRDTTFFAEEKYVFNQVIRMAFDKYPKIENKIIDLIFAMHIIKNS